MIARLRGWAFAVAFYGLSVPIILLTPLAALFGRRGMIRYAHGWARTHRILARTIVGIASKVEGQLPGGPVLYAAKHEAMYETLELQLVLDEPAMVVKRELVNIPFWGWAALRYGAIPADRDSSAAALRSMLKDARALMAEGRSILIYPEGTRVAPGEAPPLKSGFAGLYRMLGLPVVPIALDSGTRWPRRGIPRSGPVRVLIGDPIPPGLPRGEIEARVHTAINALERRS